MSLNPAKMNVFFERATSRLGVNRACRVHRALIKGHITPSVRSEIRKIICVGAGASL